MTWVLQRLPPGALSGNIREQVLYPSQLLLRVLLPRHSRRTPPNAVSMHLDKPKLITEAPTPLPLLLMAPLVPSHRTSVAGNSSPPDSLRRTNSPTSSNSNSNSNSNKPVPRITASNGGSPST